MQANPLKMIFFMGSPLLFMFSIVKNDTGIIIIVNRRRRIEQQIRAVLSQKNKQTRPYLVPESSLLSRHFNEIDFQVRIHDPALIRNRELFLQHIPFFRICPIVPGGCLKLTFYGPV